MKFCKDCKFKKKMYFLGEVEVACCGHASATSYDLVTGVPQYLECRNARENEAMCGADGANWQEGKQVGRASMWKIFTTG